MVSLQNIQLLALRSDSSLQLNDSLKVTPFLVPHRDEFTETVGYKIEGPSRSALFIPDIDKWDKWDGNIVKMVASVDYAFLDGTFYANGEIPGRDMSEIPHPFMEESITLFEKADPETRSKIRFIHFNHTNPVLREGSAERKALLKAGFQIAQEAATVGL